MQEWAQQKGIEGDFAALCKNAELLKEITADVTRLATENKLSSLEKPKGIHLDSEGFSVDNDCLTPTFKLKRHAAARVYKAQIDAMYEKIVAAEAARDAASRS